VLLNGLGATKYEELFGLWNHIHVLLADNGVEPVAPEVGELVTSLDMPGCSLTVTWLDDELERMWLAPADTPAFRRQDLTDQPTIGSRESGSRRDQRTAPFFPVTGTLGTTAVDATTLEMAAWDPAARIAQLALAAMLAAVRSSEAELGRLDAVAGDGDHGSGMVRGLTAATSAALRSAASGGTLGPVLQEAGAAWADRAGGTSGVLWGLLLGELGSSLAGLDPPGTADVAAAVGRACMTIADRGGAKVGDKTMLDALAPFADALRQAAERGDDLPRAWEDAAIAAAEGALATAELVARAGRAQALSARASGSPDPGAISMSICIEAVSAVLSEHCATTDRQEHA
jgi:D-erythrulose 4-kinase